MILIRFCFSSRDQRAKSGMRARTSDQFSRDCCSSMDQRFKLILRVRVTEAVEARRIFWLSPSKSRAMRRLISRPRLQVEKVSQGPKWLSGAKAQSEIPTLNAGLEGLLHRFSSLRQSNP